jgi:hypothetical protein
MPDEAERLKLNDAKAGTGEGHCRFCKSNDHWSTRCPYKDQMEVNENEGMHGVRCTQNEHVIQNSRTRQRRPPVAPLLVVLTRPENTFRQARAVAPLRF